MQARLGRQQKPRNGQENGATVIHVRKYARKVGTIGLGLATLGDTITFSLIVTDIRKPTQPDSSTDVVIILLCISWACFTFALFTAALIMGVAPMLPKRKTGSLMALRGRVVSTVLLGSLACVALPIAIGFALMAWIVGEYVNVYVGIIAVASVCFGISLFIGSNLAYISRHVESNKWVVRVGRTIGFFGTLWFRMFQVTGGGRAGRKKNSKFEKENKEGGANC